MATCIVPLILAQSAIGRVDGNTKSANPHWSPTNFSWPK